MGVVMGLTAALLGVLAALMGLMLWMAVIFPGPTEAARGAVEARPGRCFGLGLLAALLFGAPAAALTAAPHGGTKLAGWVLFLLLGAALAIGLAGMARLLGERFRPLSPGMTPLGGLVRGTLTLQFALLLPFLGWFLFAPVVLLTLLGAGIAALWTARPCWVVRSSGYAHAGERSEGASMHAASRVTVSGDRPSTQHPAPSTGA